MTIDSQDLVSGKETTYGEAIREGFEYLLSNFPNVFVIGQGLWSPWYVGNSMTNLDKEFGASRIIDTPVSEAACTGAAVGAAIAGMRPIVVHPRMDFMLYAMDPIVNQAAKWSSMFGGQSRAPVTVRAIINRGGEQGAQHSQALHAWFAHVAGLRVVMPSTVADARDLLIASVLCDDPVIYIDNRWLYDETDSLPAPKVLDLRLVEPQKLCEGQDLTVVSSGYSTKLAVEAIQLIHDSGFTADHIDLRIINPLKIDSVVESVGRTGRLLVVDCGCKSSGFAAEVIAACMENIELASMKCMPGRVTLPDSPAPTAACMEEHYYPSSNDVYVAAMRLMVS